MDAFGGGVGCVCRVMMVTRCDFGGNGGGGAKGKGGVKLCASFSVGLRYVKERS